MSRKNIITGTLILTCANLITKCMGFFYRVFMSNAIGAEGMGLYQLILPLYMLAWSITSAGFTTTISHLAAQEYIRGQNGNIGRIVKQAVCLSLCASVAVSCVLFFGADSIALSMLRDRRAAFSLRLLALAVPFMAASSCFRGFFLGIQETLVPAFSQVLEQTVRILTIYFLAGILSRAGSAMPAVPPSAASCSGSCFPAALPSGIISIIKGSINSYASPRCPLLPSLP